MLRSMMRKVIFSIEKIIEMIIILIKRTIIFLSSLEWLLEEKDSRNDY